MKIIYLFCIIILHSRRQNNPSVCFTRNRDHQGRGHPEIFKGGGVEFFKKQPGSNRSYLVSYSQTGFRGNSCMIASLQHLFIQKPCNNDIESCR